MNGYLLKANDKKAMIVFAEDCLQAGEKYANIFNCNVDDISVLDSFYDLKDNPIDVIKFWPLFGTHKPDWKE